MVIDDEKCINFISSAILLCDGHVFPSRRSSDLTFNIKGGGGVDVVALATNTLTGSIAGEVGGVSITGLGRTGRGHVCTHVTNECRIANASGRLTDATNLAGSGTLTGTANACDLS